jgi:hypothetical protein
MEIIFRTWNLNFWKERYSSKPKSPEEKEYWVRTGKDIIKNEINQYKDTNKIRFWLLQEASLEMYKDFYEECNYNIIQYSKEFSKPIEYGLIIESIPNNNLSFNKLDQIHKGILCMSTLLNSEIKLIVINIHTQKFNLRGENYNKEYYKSLKNNIIPFVEKIISKEKNNLIVFGGDFNMNKNYGRDIFEYIENKLELIDCTVNTKYYGKSTMVDINYNMINDYIFINKKYHEFIEDVKIDKYEDDKFTDHRFIEVKINLKNKRYCA